MLVRTGEEIIDLLREGQGVLNILPLAGVKDEVDAAIVEFPVANDPADADRSRTRQRTRPGTGRRTLNTGRVPDRAAPTPPVSAAG